MWPPEIRQPGGTIHAMQDRSLIWVTDASLKITSLSARLRDLAGIAPERREPLHVADLWHCDDERDILVLAHQWTLEGESTAFESTARDGTTYAFDLQPLFGLNGNATGVVGTARNAAFELERRAPLEHVERTAGFGTWHVDEMTGRVAVSAGLAAMLGLQRDTDAFDPRTYDHPDDRAAIERAFAQRLRDETYSIDHRILDPSGRVRSVRERVRTIRDRRGIACARIGTLFDISDLKEREAELTDLAHFDALTRLPNRAMLEERLQAAIARSERQGLSCAVLFVDLDDFKHVNDRHGHHYGDEVLCAVANRLSRYVRPSDTVARIGGDEFVIVIEDLYSDEGALDAARKILRGFDEPLAIRDNGISVGASIGVATFPTAARSPRELLAIADDQMYAVKHNGGCGVKLWQQAQKETAHRNAENATCTNSSTDLAAFAIPRSA